MLAELLQNTLTIIAYNNVERLGLEDIWPYDSGHMDDEEKEKGGAGEERNIKRKSVCLVRGACLDLGGVLTTLSVGVDPRTHKHKKLRQGVVRISTAPPTPHPHDAYQLTHESASIPPQWSTF
ncbi:hypothetical protein BgiMline_013202 [Biomphalaria glabrata]